MKKPSHMIHYSVSGIFLLLATACTTTNVINANSTPAIQAQEGLSQELLLDIGIIPFDPGIPEDIEEIEEGFIVPDVRRAESGFIAYHLKDTLELTGNWGAVRVVPNPSESVDIHITGNILLSDGEQLKVQVVATDSTGSTWLNRRYEDTASKLSYQSAKEDPFQDLYNDIANDILLKRQQHTPNEIINIRQVSTLKFARSLSPDAFGNYLTENKSRTQITQLPSEDNAMLERVDLIKEREHYFIDTMDDYYGRFYQEMRDSYDEWRLVSYEEAILYRELKSQANKRLLGGLGAAAAGVYAGSRSKTWAQSAAASGIVVGGIAGVRSGLERRKDAEIHEESLRELGQSLGGEIRPHVLNIEGKTIELTGSATGQFEQWRGILKEIYAEETGVTVESNSGLVNDSSP